MIPGNPENGAELSGEQLELLDIPSSERRVRRAGDMRHEIFVREYVKDGNGYRSAVAAGYSRVSARQMASVLLAKPHIRAAIEHFQGEISAEIKLEVTDLVRQTMDNIDAAANPADGKRPDHHAVNRGIELLAKLTGNLKEKVAHEHGGKIDHEHGGAVQHVVSFGEMQDSFTDFADERGGGE